jgi:transposase
MIVLPAAVRVLVATQPVDFRRGADGLAAIVQTVLRQDPFSGTIYVFRCKRSKPATFCIRFAIRDRRLSLASVVRTNAAGLAVPARQGVDVHLHTRAAGSVPRAAELDVRRRLLRRHDARPSGDQHQRAY